TSASYTPPMLAAGTTFFWSVVANSGGGATAGPIWRFTTMPAPVVPAAPNPADGATGVSRTATRTWTASGATTYDVQFGTTNPPPQVIMGQTNASYSPPPLTAGATYFWRVVARNSGGASTGPVWSFTTIAAPSTPAAPNPADSASG